MSLVRLSIRLSLAAALLAGAAIPVETQLQKEITEIGLKFAENIRDDTGDIPLKLEELKGMPQDYTDAHKPGADGLVHLTFAYPDIFPIMDFADIRETRRKVVTAFNNRG